MAMPVMLVEQDDVAFCVTRPDHGPATVSAVHRSVATIPQRNLPIERSTDDR